jgi:TRAP-type transport system periplasmic protein
MKAIIRSIYYKAVVAALFLASGLATAQVKWDLPSAYAANNLHTENLMFFASEVDKATDGKLKITVHSNASLVKATEIKRAVQSGQAQIGEILLVNFDNESPLFGIDGIPFLATSYSASYKLNQAQKPILDKYLANQGMKLLYTVAWPPQGLFTRKPISAISEMRGMKWRAYSPGTAKMADLMGMQPVTVQASELSQALATGAIDALINSGSTAIDAKVYESLKYFYDTRAWLPKNAVIMNTKAFDALDKPSQDAVLKAAASAELRGWKSSEEKNEGYKKTLAERGMTIQEPSSKLVSDFKQVGWVMLNDWQRRAGSDGEVLIASYMNARSPTTTPRSLTQATIKPAATPQQRNSKPAASQDIKK